MDTEVTLDQIQNDGFTFLECTPSKNNCEIIYDMTDTINVDNIVFEDDENWLCGCLHKSIQNLNEWLYNDGGEIDENVNEKSVDTRTFTRPKRRFTRPAIEEHTFKAPHCDTKDIINELPTEEPPIKAAINTTVTITPSIPIQFDLNQPFTNTYFDTLVNNTYGCDSFQNISPPSLTSSMCSSNFTTLMESSLIKNDPILRDISNETEEIMGLDSLENQFKTVCNLVENQECQLDKTYDCKQEINIKTNSFIIEKDDISMEDIDEEEDMNKTIVQDTDFLSSPDVNVTITKKVMHNMENMRLQAMSTPRTATRLDIDTISPITNSPINTNTFRKPKLTPKPIKNTNLLTNLGKSQPNLSSQSQNLHSQTNLNSLNRNLKGSYTSLNPINSNLPIVDSSGNNETFAVPPNKMKPRKLSALPRPIGSATNIPKLIARTTTNRTTRMTLHRN